MNKQIEEVREKIEQAVLNFATEYHRYKEFREDISFQGIKSHPRFIDQILKVVGVVEQADHQQPSTANSGLRDILLKYGFAFESVKPGGKEYLRSVVGITTEAIAQIRSLFPEPKVLSDEVICLMVCSGCEPRGHYLGNIPLCDEHRRLKKSSQVTVDKNKRQSLSRIEE